MLWIGASLMISVFMYSCGGNEDAAPQENAAYVIDKNCTFSYDENASSLKWTAFKTTDRIAVGGSFDSVLVTFTDTSYSPKQALRNASFTIFTNSVFTDNAARDETIRKFFFSQLKGDGTIIGEVKSVEGDDSAGGGTVKLKLNEVTRDIGFKYTISGNEIVFTTKINLNSFEGGEAVASLNTNCNEVHKGPDGISKLWPDLEIEVKASLIKNCK